ncbi:MAG: putative hydro-lyase [Rhodospirillaceae bacterium]|nr:putative hydro-lyase [Rhodospirillaceae bacterium]
MDTVAPADARPLSARELRARARAGTFDRPTSGHAPGMHQGNLVILPREVADAFLQFCVANPKPCPLLHVGGPGDPTCPDLGQDIDLRTDLPGYRVWRHGKLADRVKDIRTLWTDDMVAFVLGCSFSFEEAVAEAGVEVRHRAVGRNVPMYRTGIRTAARGPFSGPLVVSMRPFAPADAIRAIVISARFPKAHGAPVHLGNPAAIGIANLENPDYGDPPILNAGDVPVFWACGVTPQAALEAAAPPLAITHDPGHMLVTDRPSTPDADL